MEILNHVTIPALTFNPVLDTTVIVLTTGTVVFGIIKFSYTLIKNKIKENEIEKNVHNILKDLYDKSNYKTRNLCEIIYDDSLTLYIEDLKKNTNSMKKYKDKTKIWDVISLIEANELNRQYIKPHVTIKNSGYNMTALNKSTHFQSYENNIKLINEKICNLISSQ